MKNTSKFWFEKFMEYVQLCEEEVNLRMGENNFKILSNSRPLLDTLTSYFSHILTNYEHKPKKIYAVEYPGIKLDLPFTDFKREAGKVGRKDSIYDLDDGRLLLKVRTGVIFLQSEDYLVAVGPCESNPNQVINYTLNQYMTDLQRKDWTICHASSLEVSGVGIGIAAASGGGKSTLMLKLMELEEARFVTNDRLFMKEIDDVIEARGIAKLPRINPGTIINNDRLGNILTAEKKIELSKMSREELWCLEEKYDVDIEVLYGLEKIVHDTALKHLFILDWSLDSESPTKVSTADASDEDVLKAVMKSPGPFYSDTDRKFLEGQKLPPKSEYIENLSKINILKVSGKINFEYVVDYCKELLS